MQVAPGQAGRGAGCAGTGPGGAVGLREEPGMGFSGEVAPSSTLELGLPSAPALSGCICVPQADRAVAAGETE